MVTPLLKNKGEMILIYHENLSCFSLTNYLELFDWKGLAKIIKSTDLLRGKNTTHIFFSFVLVFISLRSMLSFRDPFRGVSTRNT